MLFNEKNKAQVAETNSMIDAGFMKYTNSVEFTNIVKKINVSTRTIVELKSNLQDKTDKEIINIFLRDADKSLFTNAAIGSALKISKDNILNNVKNRHLVSIKCDELFKKDNFIHYSEDLKGLTISSRAIKCFMPCSKREVKESFEFNGNIEGILESLVIQDENMGRIYSSFIMSNNEITILQSYQINRENLCFVKLDEEFTNLIKLVSFNGVVEVKSFNVLDEINKREEINEEVKNIFGLSK